MTLLVKVKETLRVGVTERVNVPSENKSGSEGSDSALFNSFSVYKNLNPRTKLRYKEFLLQVAKAWPTEQMEAAQAESDTDLVRPGP
jgi:hypothetical protein